MYMQRLYKQFIPTHYQITWDLTKANERTITGSVTITGEQKNAEHIVLHAKDLIISRLTVNGIEAPFTHGDDDELTIAHTGSGEVTIAADFSLALTDSMHGIYPCYYEVDGEKKELYATQFESHHAREAFHCVDGPEAKAACDVTLLTDD